MLCSANGKWNNFHHKTQIFYSLHRGGGGGDVEYTSRVESNMTFKGHTVKEERWGDKQKHLGRKNLPLWAAYCICTQHICWTAIATALRAPLWYLQPERTADRCSPPSHATSVPLWALLGSPSSSQFRKSSLSLSYSHQLKVEGHALDTVQHPGK